MSTSDNIPWIEKYQPDSLDKIYGNESIINKLQNMALKNNMTNMIISGPPGIGKTKCIYCFSKLVLKTNYKDAILELNGSEDRGINTVRVNIKSFAQKKVILPKGIYKIIILDEADSITVGSQQALRRIIENYSKTTRFVFICNEHSKIIEAIQSRCTILNMNKLLNKDIVSLLVDICNAEKINYDIQGLEKISHISNGDMRQAINNLQNTYYCFRLINSINVDEICDISQKTQLERVITFCNNSDIYSSCKIIRNIYNSGYSCDDIINMLFEILKDTELIEEQKKIIYIKEISLTGLLLNEGYTTILQLYGLLSRFCLNS